MSSTPEVFWPFVVLSIGACVGSFLNVCICRLPQGRSVVTPASACPVCGHCLAWWENIPVLSFLLLRGRCRKCGIRISLQYPVVETASALLALALWNRFGFSLDFFVYSYFAASLLVVTAIDLEHQIIPDVISLPGIVAGFFCSFLVSDLLWYDSLLGIILGGGLLYLVAAGYYLVTKREGMGGGDIKLLAMIGAFLGWRAIPLVVFLSAVVGSVLGLAYLLVRRGGRHMAIPYGPFLAGAAMVTLFWGRQLVAWYTDFLAGI